MADVLQHVKGSEVAAAMAGVIRPNQYYKITLEVEDQKTEAQKLSDWKKALMNAKGMWKDRPNIEEDMKKIRAEFDREF